MGFFGPLFVLLVSFGLAYFTYDYLFIPNPALSKEQGVEQVTVTGPDGKVKMKVDMAADAAKYLPEQTTLEGSVTLYNAEGAAIEFTKGYKAKVLSYAAGKLQITDQGEAFKGEIAYDQTDVIAAIGQAKYTDLLGLPTAPDPTPAPAIAMPPAPAPEPAVAAPPAQLPAPEPEVASLPTSQMPAPAPEPTPAVEVTEAPPVSTAPLASSDLITAMQASVKARAVSEFETSGVLKWENGDNETIDGTEYQVGFATYEKETIFGNQPVVAKALIKGGKVVKWVYAKTGLEIP